MNVIINVPSQLNILFTLDELTVVIRVEEKACTIRRCICVGEKNYMANYLLRHQAIVGARDGINSAPSIIMDCFKLVSTLIQLCIFKYVFYNITRYIS